MSKFIDDPTPSESRSSFAQTIVDMCQAHASPSKYGILADTLEGFLSNPNSTFEFHALEEYAEFSSCSASTDDGEARVEYEENPPIFVLKSLEECYFPEKQSSFNSFKDRIFLEDMKRIQIWKNSLKPKKQNSKFQVFRATNAHTQQVEFYAMGYDGARFKIFPAHARLKHSIEKMLVSTFNISNSEMQIMRELLLSKSFSEISKDTGKSIETIRTQFKSAAAKIGLSRQQEVTNFIHSISEFGERVVRPVAAESSASEFILSDGRSIFFDKLGDLNGAPFLFMHDYANGRHWPEKTISEFAKRKMCVYSISRSGFGKSTPVNKTGLTLLDQHVADIHEIITAEGIEKASFLSFGTGFAVAYRFALAFPERVEKIMGVDIYPPVLTRQDAMNFPKGFYRSSIYAALLVPKTHEVFSKIAAKRAKAVENPAELEKMLNLELFPDEGAQELFDEVVRKNLQDLALSKFDGAWRDCTFITKDWALADQNLNSRPLTFVMQHTNFPSLNIKAARDFSQTIDMTFEETDRPFRFLFGETDVIFKQLDQLHTY